MALIASYEAMPLRYKMLYWSIVGGPVILTAAALAQRFGVLRLDDFLSYFFWPLAILYWLLMIPLTINRVRGGRALRRGVSPVPPVRKVDYYSPRWELVFLPIMIVLFVSLAVHGYAAHEDGTPPLCMALLSSAFFSTILYQFVVKKFQLYGSVIQV